jgi:hypothetical protein
MLRGVRRLLAFAMLLLALFSASCLSPTLPLPPPEAPDFIESLAGGEWSVRGECTPGAIVLVKNNATGVIAGITDIDRDGRYTVTIKANECDLAQVWENINGTVTSATAFVVRPQVKGVPSDNKCKAVP